MTEKIAIKEHKRKLKKELKRNLNKDSYSGYYKQIDLFRLGFQSIWVVWN
jgi:hypothetical protein